MSNKVVIIGGSHAGISVADHLRKSGFSDPVTLICSERELPYQRPPLSKAYMAGEMSLERLHLRPSEWFSENDIKLMLGVEATSIDRANRRVHVGEDEPVSYDTLVLATGASPRTLPTEAGGSLENVHVMRDLSDANTLMEKMVQGRSLVVIGGGYIGLEAAAEAAKKGVRVTVIEAADRILRRVACKETADAFRGLHESHGVHILENTQISMIDGNDDGTCKSVVLADGTSIDADLVIVGIGVSPNVSLALNAGLEVAVGITVDDHALTSDPNIYACGDCTILPFKHAPTRLESVQNANDQGAVVAANIAGFDTTYSPEPWFWSDQYDMKLQIAGLNRGYDRIVTRPGRRDGSVSHFYFNGEEFLAVDCMNDGATYAMSRKILASDAKLTPSLASDPEFSLKSLLG